MIVNQANNAVWRWENTHTFGANLPDEDPDGNSQLFEYHPRFPGQYFDKETNFHYNYFRYYEPETGRYISPDPIGLAGGLNTYGYVNGDPLLFVDPDGLNPRLIYEVIIKSANKIKKIWDDLDFDGANPGLQHGNGRVCQVRYKKKSVIRLDYQPYPGTKGESRLHLDFDSLGIKHVPLDPRRLFDE